MFYAGLSRTPHKPAARAVTTPTRATASSNLERVAQPLSLTTNFLLNTTTTTITATAMSSSSKWSPKDDEIEEEEEEEEVSVSCAALTACWL
jgi:hypothetical protein